MLRRVKCSFLHAEPGTPTGVKEPRQTQPEPQVLEGEDDFPASRRPPPGMPTRRDRPPELGTRRGRRALAWRLFVVLAVCAFVLWIAVR